jgi:hypothetical protein
MKAFHLAWIRLAVCLFCSSAAFLPADCRSSESSLGTRRPVIRKLGTIDCDLVETTPLVFRNTLYRFEWVRASYRKNTLQKDHFRLVINYSWGNQQGIEFLAEAVYEGTEADFLRAWFPEARSRQ